VLNWIANVQELSGKHDTHPGRCGALDRRPVCRAHAPRWLLTPGPPSARAHHQRRKPPPSWSRVVTHFHASSAPYRQTHALRRPWLPRNCAVLPVGPEFHRPPTEGYTPVRDQARCADITCQAGATSACRVVMWAAVKKRAWRACMRTSSQHASLCHLSEALAGPSWERQGMHDDGWVLPQAQFARHSLAATAWHAHIHK
jgi:hypothetical protein